MKRVVLVTGHYLESKRRAGFHWLADAYWRHGWEVMFFTAKISWLSWLRRDHRFAYPARREARRLRWVQERLASYVWFTPWHPLDFGIGVLNWLSRPFFAPYGRFPLGEEAEERIKHADLIVFDATPGLMLFERFQHLNPSARYVYRVSDDLRLLRSSHPVVLEAEERCAPHFDLISVPYEILLQRFDHLPNAALHYHAIRKDIFDRDWPTPYQGAREVNAVFVGVAYFDHDFLAKAAPAFPNWAFHIIGPIPRLPRRDNVVAYGEIPFEETVPLLKHADIGLHTLAYRPGAEYLTRTLKVVQYTYCRLPVVAPDFLRSQRTNMFYYRPGDEESIRQALESARALDRSRVSAGDIRSWDELAQILAGE